MVNVLYILKDIIVFEFQFYILYSKRQNAFMLYKTKNYLLNSKIAKECLNKYPA